MRRPRARRWLAAAALALAALLADGCTRSHRAAGGPDKPPRVRVEGARILDPDPERDAAPAPAPEPAAAPTEAATPSPSAPPPDVAAGVTVSLDVVDARATEILRGLAYQGNVDLVFSGTSDRRLTLRLQDMPWTEAFEAVLSAGGLLAEWDGRRVRVLTPDQLRTERETADRLERQRPATEIVPLQNLPAKEMAPALTSVLSEGGRIAVEEELNALVVTDAASRIETLRQAIRGLDHVPPQVMIEAIIVDVTLNDELHSGFDWTATKPNGTTITLRQALTVGAGLNPVTNPGGVGTFTYLGERWTITGVYDLLQTMDSAKILANPKVLAINNRKARIEIIDEIPYQELTQTSAGGQIGTTSFKEVGIKLEVTPRIADDGTVHLELTAEQSAPTGAAVNQIPVIQTRRTATVMTVGDGRVVVLGGLRRHRTVTNEDKIPLLGDVPLLGAIFRRVETADVETELVIFIRPKIVRPGQGLTARERTLAEAIDHVDRRTQIIRTDPLRINVLKENERTRSVP